jgi:hypothetical protein
MLAVSVGRDFLSYHEVSGSIAVLCCSGARKLLSAAQTFISLVLPLVILPPKCVKWTQEPLIQPVETDVGLTSLTRGEQLI